MKNDTEDVKEAKTCRINHKLQFVEVDKDGNTVQYCPSCGRKLKIR